MKKEPRLHLRLTPEHKEWLRTASFTWRLPMGKIVTNALDEFIEKRGEPSNEK